MNEKDDQLTSLTLLNETGRKEDNSEYTCNTSFEPAGVNVLTVNEVYFVFPPSGRRRIHSGGAPWFQGICTISWNHPEFDCPPGRQNTDLRSAENRWNIPKERGELRAERKVLGWFNKWQTCFLTSSYVIRSPRRLQETLLKKKTLEHKMKSKNYMFILAGASDRPKNKE